MRKTLFRTLAFLGIAALFSGCASYVVPKPSAITLQDAMQSVGEGLVQMKKAQGELRTGLVPDEVEVIFNVCASGEQGGKLYLELSPIPTGATPLQGKAGSELTGKYTAWRGNQVTIKLKNIVFADPTKTPLKDPATIQKLLDILKAPENRDAIYCIQ